MRKPREIKQLTLHRCNLCQLIVPEYLASTEDIQHVKQKAWKCTCEKEEQLGGNTFNFLNCKRCKQIVPSHSYQRAFIFERYIPLVRKDDQILNYLKLVADNQFIPTKENVIKFLELKERLFLEDRKYAQSVEITELFKYFKEFLMPDKLPAPFERQEDKVKQNNAIAPERQSFYMNKPQTKMYEIIKYINLLLTEVKNLREFEERVIHKRYLDLIEEVIYHCQQIITDAQHNSEKMNKAFQNISIKTALTNSKNNGIISPAFKKITPADEADMRKRLDSKQYQSYSMIHSNDLKTQKVLIDFTLNKKTVPKIIDNLKFYVFHKKETGFSIKIVYLEDSWQNIIVQLGYCNYKEVSLGEINIPPEHFLELLRTVNYKAETTLGYAKFSVEKFVRLLNGILVKSYARKTRQMVKTSEKK